MIASVNNMVHDSNYTAQVAGWGFPILPKPLKAGKKSGKSDPFADILSTFTSMFGSKKPQKDDQKTNEKSGPVEPSSAFANKDLKDQLKTLIEMPDPDYNPKKLTSTLRKYLQDVETEFNVTMNDYKSHIAASYRQVKTNYFNISGIYGRTYYTESFPTYLENLRMRSLIGFHNKWDMSFFIFPEDDAAISGVLKMKATQLKAEMGEAISKGITLDTEVEQQYRDVDMIRQKLTTREERYFETGYYITMYHMDSDKLNEESKKFQQKISGLGIRLKQATQRMDEGFTTALPLCIDELAITRSTITSGLAGSFPFISSDMLSKTGIVYGINLHTGGLVIYDRFKSALPSMNSVVLATSGAGKSFAVKLEVLRYLVAGIKVMVIDPENEYISLIKKIGGTYINIATSSNQFVNPFDLPPKIEDQEYGKGDLLRSQIMNLIGFVSILVWGMNASEEALMDKALQMTYQLKGMTLNDIDYSGKEPPIMQDLLNVLEGTNGADNIALRLSKFVGWTFGKIFNNHTNVDLNADFTVFSIRDLEETLKTPAMYNILNFIRTKVRSEKVRRLLMVDEAWIMLQNDISANFLFGLIKRARKYGLGITTISQDIEDFMKSKYGKPIISNSPFQLLLKQSTTSLSALKELLGLSEAEQQRLIAAGVGEGIIFAGTQHIAVKITASPQEIQFITTDVK